MPFSHPPPSPTRALLALARRLPPPTAPRVGGPASPPPPPPAPAGGKSLYGHVWVPLAALARHPAWGTLALPLHARPYIRRADLPELPPDRRRPFRTKLELAAEELA